MSSAKKRRGRRIIYRKKSQNRASMLLAIAVMLVILVAVAVRGFSLTRKLRDYDEKKSQLQSDIASEQQRSQQIEEYSKYTQTDEYVEEVARDKLGLVKEGETVFRKDGTGITSSSDDAASDGSETPEETEGNADSAQVQGSQSSAGTAAESSQASDGAAAENPQETAGTP